MRVSDTPKTIPVMEGVETQYIGLPHSFSLLRRLSPLWRGLRLSLRVLEVPFKNFAPKTIPVMEGVETISACDTPTPLWLRRLSPLWRGLRPNPSLGLFIPDLAPKTIPVMEGVETKLNFHGFHLRYAPKTIPVMEGVETQ